MTELWQQSASALARGIATRAFSCREVLDAHLDRIAVVNPAINAIVRLLADEAQRDADAADRVVASGASLGALHGVPFTVKENIDVAGLPTSWGVVPLADATAPSDAPVVERMRAAGAIMIGRTNLPDMALRLHTDSSLHGLTLNPWNAARTVGGSSGGEAAALATGMSAIGLGNDIGGSLRSPASACGIASIRPSIGRVPDAGVIPAENRLLVTQLMNVQGPMARSIGDVRLALNVLMGHHPRDPWSLDMPLAGPPAVGPVRVAMLAEPPGCSTDPAVAAAVRRAGAALADAGYEVVEAVPPHFEEAVELAAQFLMGDYAAVLDQLGPLMGDGGRTFLETYRSATAPVPDTAAMSHLFASRDGIARAWSLFMDAHPLILSPTWSQVPFEVGRDIATRDGGIAVRSMIGPVMPANLLGLPSACVSAGMDDDTGLPVGVLLTGRRYRDDQCLDGAEHIERRLGVAVPIDPR